MSCHANLVEPTEKRERETPAQGWAGDDDQYGLRCPYLVRNNRDHSPLQSTEVDASRSSIWKMMAPTSRYVKWATIKSTVQFSLTRTNWNLAINLPEHRKGPERGRSTSEKSSITSG
ncbi:hypothetical protein EYF80_024291 [Liparis tanakae]|uniref:Uncharacterized protein n=1 Tax=Liparis tanakae TaxID=230148 RepID=A0A4Z2HKV9_9TELE|nr:hypothetical protein EYF80_024291 [Liparis tanakae]